MLNYSSIIFHYLKNLPTTITVFEFNTQIAIYDLLCLQDYFNKLHVHIINIMSMEFSHFVLNVNYRPELNCILYIIEIYSYFTF